MSHITLERADDWKLEHPGQDVRGWPVHDPAGRTVGVVDKMIIDTAKEVVDILVLESGVEVAVESVAIGDDIVFLQSQTDGPEGVVEVFDDDGRLVDRELIYDDETVGRFRQHYGTAYAATGRGYEDYDFAYRYGYANAHDDRYVGRNYTAAGEDLRAGFATEYPDYRYDDYGHAVQYGYEQGYSRNS